MGEKIENKWFCPQAIKGSLWETGAHYHSIFKGKRDPIFSWV